MTTPVNDNGETTGPTDAPPRHLHPVDREPPFDPDYDHPAGSDGGGGSGRGNTPLADRRAEQALLAALITDPTTTDRINGHLDANDFYWPTHQTIWDTWHHLHQTDGVPPDAVILNTHLVRNKHHDAARTLLDLVSTPTEPVLATRYAQIVRDHARLRVAADTAAQLTRITHEGNVDQVDLYLSEALQRVEEATLRYGPATPDPKNAGLHDLGWLLTGDAPTQAPPAYTHRQDGHALFYAGKVNGVFGDPESGKTWLAQTAIVEALNNGRTAAMIDVDHNGPEHTAARLLLLGAHLEDLADPNRFRYYEPEDNEQLLAAVDDITTWTPAVYVLDSLGEVLPMMGVKSVDNDEITAALRRVCTPPATAGSCVITIDHLPKNPDARGTGYAIGGTAKKRMMRGSYLRAEARTQPAPGQIGRITVRIEKDTVGELRKHTPGGYAGTFVLDSTHSETSAITKWWIERETAPVDQAGQFRPTQYMERISKFIEENDLKSFRGIKDAVPGKDTHLRKAIKLLVDEGFVTTIAGPKNSTLHHSVAAYREAEDDHLNTA